MQVECLACQVSSLAQRLVASPSTLVGSVFAIPDCETELTLQRWNATSAPYDAEATAHSLFEDVVQRGLKPLLNEAVANSVSFHRMHNPEGFFDGSAVVFEGETVSYRELEQRTSRLADNLHKSPVCPDSVVGLCVVKSVEEVAGMVGIMRAGAAYVPLDPKLPAERLAYLVQQCSCVAVVTQRRHSNRFEHAGNDFGSLEVVIAEDAFLRCLPCAASSCELVQPASASALAYVLFTSGSTGKPKALMLQHSSLVAFLSHQSGPYKCWHQEQSHTRLYVLSCMFDDSVGVVWRTLVSGARLYVTKPDAWLDSSYLAHLLNAHSISSMWGVPSPFALVMDAISDVLPAALVDLHLSGEALPPELSARVLKNAHTALYNPYGPAEVTINSHAHPCEHKDSTQSRVPIGVTLPNTSGFVLGQQLSLVPVHVGGELYLGGPKLSRGYSARPDLTAGSYTHCMDQRLYRTGDRVRWLSSGELEFLGRVDFQIKLNGQRIEAGEIEAVITRVPGVQAALVVPRKTAAGIDRLVTYLLPETVQERVVLEACSSSLPAYMVPSAVVALSAWPLSSSGKLNQKALPDATTTCKTIEPTASMSTLEHAVAEACAHVLKVPLVNLGRNSSLLALGLTSLQAAILHRELQRRGLTGIKSAVTVLLHPSVAALASLYPDQQTKEEPHAALATSVPSFTGVNDAIAVRDSLHAALSLQLQPTVGGLLATSQIGDTSVAPLVFVYGALGCAYMTGIFKHFDSSQPIYHMIAPDLGSDRIRFEDFESRAQHHALVLQELFPKTIVHVFGYSYGAPVAVGIVKHLKNSTLTLCEPELLSARPLELQMDPSAVLARFAHSCDAVINGFATAESDACSFEAAVKRGDISSERYIEREVFQLVGGEHQPVDLLCDMATFCESVQTQVPTLQDALCSASHDVTIFMANGERERWGEDGAYGWADCFGSVTVVEIDGSHMSLSVNPKTIESIAHHLKQTIAASVVE